MSKSKLSIKPFGDKFVVVDGKGNPFNNTMYPTERGAKQAITKAGHTYDAPKATKEKTGKSKKNLENRVNMPEDDILELRADCLAAAGFTQGMTSEQVKACDWSEANRVAVAGGFSSYFALKAVCKGIRYGRKSDAEKAELAQKQEARKSDRAADKAAIESGELSSDMAQARNALARVNGFPRYRSLERAITHGTADVKAKAKAVKAMIDKTVPFAKVKSSKAA